jgi:hypothetical protein
MDRHWHAPRQRRDCRRSPSHQAAQLKSMSPAMAYQLPETPEVLSRAKLSIWALKTLDTAGWHAQFVDIYLIDKPFVPQIAL